MLKSNIVSVSGIDGSGKSTFISILSSNLFTRGISNRVYWLRYNHYISKIILLIAKILGFTRYEWIGSARIGYHDFYKSKILSHAYIISTVIDLYITSFFLVYTNVYLFRKLVVCDRWTSDIAIDLMIDTRINIFQHNFYFPLIRFIVPKETLMILVLRSENMLKECREENQYDENFLKRLRLYKSLPDYHEKFIIFDNSKDILHMEEYINDFICERVLA